jgi:protein SCO1/2
LNTELLDEAGHPVPLRRMFGERPVILDLGYYHCPSLCGVVRADLLSALKPSGLIGGRDYTLVVLSIDPAETPRDAAEAKAADLTRTPEAIGDGWHYLTGSSTAISAIESTIGFHARYDPDLRQFLHPAGLAVIASDGVVSGYLLGVGYTGEDMREAVARASAGDIARSVEPVLLLCFHFDPNTGRYTLAIEKVLRLMGLLTVSTLGGLMILMHRRWPGA